MAARTTAHSEVEQVGGEPSATAAADAQPARVHERLREARRHGVQRVIEGWRAGTLPRVLMVTHGWGGGVAKHIDDLARGIAEHADVFTLQGGDASVLTLSRQADRQSRLVFRADDDIDALTNVLASIGLVRMHFHHVHRLPRAILDLPRVLGVAYDVTLHDHFAICPQYVLVGPRGEYCGEPDEAGCNACIAERTHAWNLDIATWRRMFDAWLAHAARVIAPSQDLATRVQRYLPRARLEIRAHPQPSSSIGDRRNWIKVAVLGTLAPEKGLHLVQACARDARTRGLPLVFDLIGSVSEPVAMWPTLPLRVLGSYDDPELDTLLALERADVIWFPTRVPESFSYTLSAALRTGVAVVAPRLGAFAQRLVSVTNALMLEWDADASAWNDALLIAATARRGAQTIAPASNSADTNDGADYLRWYLDALPTRHADSAQRSIALDFEDLAIRQTLAMKQLESRPSPALAELVMRVTECGQRSKHEELRRRALEADREFVAMRRRIRELELDGKQLREQARHVRDVADEIERERDAAREHAAQLEASTFWRMTYPLRWLVNLLTGRPLP